MSGIMSDADGYSCSEDPQHDDAVKDLHELLITKNKQDGWALVDKLLMHCADPDQCRAIAAAGALPCIMLVIRNSQDSYLRSNLLAITASIAQHGGPKLATEIAAAGGVDVSLKLLDNDDTNLAALAAAALHALSIARSYRDQVAAARPFRALAQLLSAGVHEDNQWAAAALLNDICLSSPKAAAGAEAVGVIHPLVQLLSSQDEQLVETAVEAVCNMANVDADIRSAIIGAEGVTRLVDLLGSSSTDLQLKAINALEALAQDAENKLAASLSGALDGLVAMLDSEVYTVLHAVAQALLQLTNCCPEACQLLTCLGGVTGLVDCMYRRAEWTDSQTNQLIQVSTAILSNLVSLAGKTAVDEILRTHAEGKLANLVVNGTTGSVRVCAAQTLMQLERQGTLQLDWHALSPDVDLTNEGNASAQTSVIKATAQQQRQQGVGFMQTAGSLVEEQRSLSACSSITISDQVQQQERSPGDLQEQCSFDAWNRKAPTHSKQQHQPMHKKAVTVPDVGTSEESYADYLPPTPSDSTASSSSIEPVKQHVALSEDTLDSSSPFVQQQQQQVLSESSDTASAEDEFVDANSELPVSALLSSSNSYSTGNSSEPHVDDVYSHSASELVKTREPVGVSQRSAALRCSDEAVVASWHAARPADLHDELQQQFDKLSDSYLRSHQYVVKTA